MRSAQPPRAQGQLLKRYGFSDTVIATMRATGHVHVMDGRCTPVHACDAHAARYKRLNDWLEAADGCEIPCCWCLVYGPVEQAA